MSMTLDYGAELPLGGEPVLDDNLLDLIQDDRHLPLRFLRQPLYRIERVGEKQNIAFAWPLHSHGHMERFAVEADLRP